MKSAVVDMGSARAKVTIAERLPHGGYAFSGSAIDTGLSGMLAKNDIKAAGEVVVDVIRTIKEKTLNENIEKILFLGTQVFRDQPDLAAIARTAASSFTILSPQEEAVFFYKGVVLEENLAPDEFWALDAGGGSIQLIWSENQGDNISAPVGTYALEKKFQTDKEFTLIYQGAEWQTMIDNIKDQFKSLSFVKSEGRKLVVGSSIMQDFFYSAMGRQGFYTMEDLSGLMKKISGKPYKETYGLFPANTGFMHGADKLIAIITAVLSCGSFSGIIPTNSSLSKGLCRVLIETPEYMEKKLAG